MRDWLADQWCCYVCQPFGKLWANHPPGSVWEWFAYRSFSVCDWLNQREEFPEEDTDAE